MKATATEPNYFEESKNKIKQYIDQRILLLRLQATEKVSDIAAVIITVVVIVLVAIFLLIFLSITAGFWLSDITGSPTAGFGIVAGFYLLLFLFVIFYFKNIMQSFFINKLIKLIHKKN